MRVTNPSCLCLLQVLAENKLGTEGGKAIAEMLVNNRNLYKVDLTGNEIGDGAAPMFCEVLYVSYLVLIYFISIVKQILTTYIHHCRPLIAFAGVSWFPRKHFSLLNCYLNISAVSELR